MNTKFSITVILIILLFSCNYCIVNRVPEVSSGKIVRIKNFRSKFVKPRNIDVWLPESYDTNRKYAVVYMHDGQMLFDSTITPNKQEWQTDETITKLSSGNKIRDCIVVGIFYNKKYRGAEFIPMVVLDGLAEPYRSRYIIKQMRGKPLSDDYLKFMVLELKPYIDKTFSTKTDPANTITIGSSGGGLISVYAFCKYPEIFGGAACLSTFWPMDSPWIQNNRREITDSLFATLNRFILSSLLNSPRRKIYFDTGSEKNFWNYQLLVDSVMKKAGYSSENWITRRFPYDDHSERSWSRRLYLPLEFLLPK